MSIQNGLGNGHPALLVYHSDHTAIFEHLSKCKSAVSNLTRVTSLGNQWNSGLVDSLRSVVTSLNPSLRIDCWHCDISIAT
jgi:hypothetical protein